LLLTVITLPTIINKYFLIIGSSCCSHFCNLMVTFVNKSDHQITFDILSVSEIGGCVLDPCSMELVILTNASDINTEESSLNCGYQHQCSQDDCIVTTTLKYIQCIYKHFTTDARWVCLVLLNMVLPFSYCDI